MALHRLREAGHDVVGVNPALPDLDGFACVAAVSDLPAGIHTATLYLGKARSDEISDQILSYGFRRAIFNPGAENRALAQRLSESGVEVLEACTLVMLSTRRF
jgi:predicted CoA-binding protein